MVLRPGPDLPTDRLETFLSYLTIGVNRLWRVGLGFTPAVSFWTRRGVYEERPEWFDRSLCVCDRAAAARPWHIGLPAGLGKLPGHASDLDPCVLYRRADAAVTAALWAVSVGCWPVVLLGVGGDRRGRGAAQTPPALAEALAMAYRRPGEWRDTLWPWGREAMRPAVWASRVHSQRLRPCDPAAVTRELRRFYAKPADAASDAGS